MILALLSSKGSNAIMAFWTRLMGVYIALDMSSLCKSEPLWRVLDLLPRPLMSLSPDEVLIRKYPCPHSSAQRQLEVLMLSWKHKHHS